MFNKVMVLKKRHGVRGGALVNLFNHFLRISRRVGLCNLVELCPLRFACALARSLKLFDKRLMAPAKAKIRVEAKAELMLRLMLRLKLRAGAEADAKAEAAVEAKGRG